MIMVMIHSPLRRINGPEQFNNEDTIRMIQEAARRTLLSDGKAQVMKDHSHSEVDREYFESYGDEESQRHKFLEMQRKVSCINISLSTPESEELIHHQFYILPLRITIWK